MVQTAGHSWLRDRWLLWAGAQSLRYPIFSVSGGGGGEDASGGTAFITDPGNTMKIAPYSEMYSGLDSSAASGSEIVRWEWDFDDSLSSDPQTDEGMLVAHKYDNSGTYTVQLTIYNADGTSAVTTAETVVVGFTGTTYYVKIGGSDGSDGLSDGNAWGTLVHSVSAMGGADDNPNQLLLNRGDTWSLANGLSIAGPSRIGAYGTGANPLLSFTDADDGLGLGSEENQTWGRSRVVDNLDIHNTSGVRVNKDIIKSNVNGNTIRGCNITDGGFYMSHTLGVEPSGHALHQTIEDCTVSGGSTHGLWVAHNTWLCVRRSDWSNNGNSTQQTHQVYIDICRNVLWEDGVLSNSELTANYALKQNSIVNGLFKRTEIREVRNGIDCGNNWSDFNDPDNTNIIHEGMIIHTIGNDNQGAAVALKRSVSVTFRNCLFYNLMITPSFANAVIRFMIPGEGVAPSGQVIKILNCVFYDNEAPEIDIDTTVTQYESIIIKNNIFYRTDAVTSDHTFYEISNDEVIIEVLDSNNNCFYHDLIGQSTISIAVSGSTPSHSYDTWRSEFSQDTSSIWGNPNFISIGTPDFSLSGNSPAIDAGVELAHVWKDIDGITRPVNLIYDIGAYEQ